MLSRSIFYRVIIVILTQSIWNAETASVTVTYDVSKAPDLEDFARQAKKTMEDWFPYISYILRSPNYAPTSRILMTFDPNYKGVAYAEYWNSKIVGSVDYYRGQKSDIGSMIHEMVHVIQYYDSKTPSWIWEGVADYVRYYEYNGDPINRKPTKPTSSQSYRDGYGVTAYFINYVVKNVRNDMVYWVNKDAREGTYADSIWPRLTGKTLDQLWNDMLRNG